MLRVWQFLPAAAYSLSRSSNAKSLCGAFSTDPLKIEAANPAGLRSPMKQPKRSGVDSERGHPPPIAASTEPATGCLRPVTFHTSRFSTKGITSLVNKAEGSAISLESVHRGELFVETGDAWRGRRILVVEDQEDNRQIVRDLLTATDYKIIEARNGKEAIMAASEEPPDLILMDIQLPIMSGYDATRCIKANPALRRIPIIAVTSYALSGEDAHARAAGCDDVVAKPYSPRHLLAKIRRFLP